MSSYLVENAYDTYMISLGLVNRGNKPLVSWKEVDPKTKQAFTEVVQSVLNNISDVLQAISFVEEDNNAQAKAPK